MLKKITACFLVCVMAMGILSSCSSDEKKYKYKIDQTKFNVINSDGTSEYTIVRPESASNDILDLCVALKKAILEKTGVELEIKSDFEKAGRPEFQRQDHEILVGFTNREETEIALKEISGERDFAIVQSGSRIAIVAGLDHFLGDATAYFTENFVDEKNCTVSMNHGEKYVYLYDYAIDDFTLNGRDISEYTVCYTNDSYRYYVDLFNSYLSENYGKTVAVSKYKKGEYNIILHPEEIEFSDIKNELAPLETKVVADENDIILLCGNLTDEAVSVKAFFDEYFSTSLVEKQINVDIATNSDIISGENIYIDDEKIIADLDQMAKERREYIKNTPNMFTSLPEGSTNRIYYISENGDDENDGLSPESAWASIRKLRNVKLNHGDIVLFERGSMFRGKFKASAGVTYSAYGEGEKPVINGSEYNYAIPAVWSETDVKNVYRCNMGFDNVGGIVFNYSGVVGNYDELYGDMQVYGLNDFNGYEMLDADLEFCFDLDLKALYLYSAKGNPGERFSSIDISDSPNIVQGSEEDVVIDNLMFVFGGGHGMGAGTVKNRTVTNCIFAWIGGSILKGFNGGNVTRYGNAVEVFGGCNGYYVYDNWCYQIYDTGITHQYSENDLVIRMENIEYRGNLVEYCHWSIEYYNKGKQGSYIHNVRVHDNMCLYGAYGWGSVGREQASALHNSFGIPENIENYVVEDNIFAYTRSNLVRYYDTDRKITFRNNTYIQYYERPFGHMMGHYRKFDSAVYRYLTSTMKEENPVIVFVMDDPEKIK